MSFGTILFGLPLSLINLHPDTLAYNKRITSKGLSISKEHIVAIDSFVKTIYSNGLRNKFVGFYPFAGESFSSALEALWYPSGLPSNLGVIGTFNTSNYGKNSGINTIDANNKVLDTRIVLNNSDLWSYSLYKRTISTTSIGMDLGSGGNDFICQGYSGDRTYYSGRTFPDTPSLGWFTGDKFKFYKNGLLAFSSGTGNNSHPSYSVFLFGRNNNGSILQATSTTLGCVSIGYTKTAPEELIIYNAVQLLMTKLGRNV